jgi:BolA family transcriptional regulator, general stress-responsive regulator
MLQITLESIHTALTSALSPSALALRDDSEKHRGHAGHREGMLTHVHVAIASHQFQGLTRVAQHRLVYAALEPFVKAGLHAIAVDTRPVLVA